ncbi:fatty-acyl-CoA synthase [Jatrophihabitans sp. GAS493]|uniref:class I adenylate-forming enzyme family protein n=1 Tax=Jatrophihabitans sp. GAS493 TaxID=1907575 RepID=UPI000BB8D8C4|nr:AMP-binding protein [Jatrophihabitans sp. GAS493]SOD74629.1 fatty-acyl-CoA synthase [Jatrophihabitans sp. GAS493]
MQSVPITTYQGDGSYTSFNVLPGDWLRLAARRAGDTTALILGDGRRVTYNQLNHRVNQLVDLLREQGIGPGDRVATMATDGLRHVEVLLATLKLGATFMPLNFRLSRREADVLLSRGEPKVLFHSGRYTELLAGIQDQHASLEHVVCLDRKTEEAGFYEDLLLGRPDAEPAPKQAGAEDIAILAFTSGTTGMPKGVQTSYRMTHSVCIVQLLETSMSRSDVYLTSSPLFHSAGYFQTLMCIYFAVPILLLEQFEPVEVQSWLARPDGPTAVFLVPTMLQTVMNVPGAREANYDQLRIISYGAAPMPPALLREAMELFGCDFTNCFGAGTENGSASWLTPADHRRAAAGEERLLGSVGRPGVGIEMRICDEDLNDVPTGTVGEIVTRNNCTMSGYLAMPERSAQSLPGDGWFRAGDLGYLDEEGYLWLNGRANDMIIRGGENVYPLEIEHVLSEHAAVSEIAVVGVPDDHWGEAVRAWVVVRPGVQTTPAELYAYSNEHLGRYKVPTEYWFVSELPKNASGKVLKRELTDWSPGVAAVGGGAV